MGVRGVGIDIVAVKRFAPFERDRKSRFLLDNFSAIERAHCFSFKDARVHLAGTFAAKEAVRKTFTDPLRLIRSIEIRRGKDGRPGVWIRNRYQRSILVSISHEKTMAVAIAVQLYE